MKEDISKITAEGEILIKETERISNLKFAYIFKTLSNDQRDELNAWMAESPENAAYIKQWDDPFWIAKQVHEYNDVPDIQIEEELKNIWAIIDKGD